MGFRDLIAPLFGGISLAIGTFALLIAMVSYPILDYGFEEPEICSKARHIENKNRDVEELCALFIFKQRQAIAEYQKYEQRNRSLLDLSVCIAMIWGAISGIAFLYIWTSNRRRFTGYGTSK